MHSKQAVKPGRIARACPLNPSVPPSIMGLMVSSLGVPSSSNSVEEAFGRRQGVCGVDTKAVS